MSPRSANRDARVERPGDQPELGFVGLISDTRRVIPPEALKALAGSCMVLHAGDVGDPDILHVLRCGNPDGNELRRVPPATTASRRT